MRLLNVEPGIKPDNTTLYSIKDQIRILQYGHEMSNRLQSVHFVQIHTLYYCFVFYVYWLVFFSSFGLLSNTALKSTVTVRCKKIV